jgi:hypothetical protein
MSSGRGWCSSTSAATTTSTTVKATSGGSPSFLEAGLAGSRSQAIPLSAAWVGSKGYMYCTSYSRAQTAALV